MHTAALLVALTLIHSAHVAVSAEATGAVDPVIQHLLKNARSEAVRQEFLRMPADDYTAKHDVHVLVSPVVTAAKCQSARCKAAMQSPHYSLLTVCPLSTLHCICTFHGFLGCICRCAHHDPISCGAAE